ncbi:MAG: VOC family protein [Spirochaetales bacterium]|nr:VOC family protein [Spirochaetales bacterium]
MPVTRIAHVCLNVQDLDRSIQWYKKLGFKEVFHFTRKGQPFGVYLQIASDSYIELFENPDMGQPINTGIVHFCLETESLETLMAEYDEAGIAYTPKKLGCDQTWQIWLKDPDGNAFEIHQYTLNSAQKKGGMTVEADW